MRKTYAYNSILVGFMLGLLVGVTTQSVVLGILAGLAVSIVGFVVIRLIENAIGRGVDKAAEKISEAHRRRKEQRTVENGGLRRPVATQRPALATAGANANGRCFCKRCGARLRVDALYCSSCGEAVR